VSISPGVVGRHVCPTVQQQILSIALYSRVYKVKGVVSKPKGKWFLCDAVSEDLLEWIPNS